MTIVPWTDCEVPSPGSVVILLGPWMPMGLGGSGTAWTDCSTPAVALSEPSVSPVAVTGVSTPLTTYNDCEVI
jgi:hypothetical protein